jgi:molybdopterin synthase catalytic subunit
VPPSLHVRLTEDIIDPSDALGFVADPAAGGTVLFTGTVRDHSDGGEVTGLDYEAWDEQARALLQAIGEEMFERWPVLKVAILHRTGHLEVGETSVVVCCSAPHRAEAFEACRHGIERVKRDVPIWKKERLATGDAHWVMGS